MKRLFLAACLLLLCFFSKAQTDTVFWFAAPKITTYITPTYLRITTLSHAATITVTQPANPSFAPLSQTISANSNYSFNLSDIIQSVMNNGSNTIDNKALKISSTQPIMAYYEVANSVNTDIFSLKGGNALGTAFIVPSMKDFESGHRTYGAPHSSMYVAATENNTVLTITPSVDLKGRPKSAGSFNITLNKGEVYCGEAAAGLAADHLGGTEVTSTKPVAITSATDLASLNCGDLNGDQLVPIRLAGMKFITLPGYLNNNVAGTDYVYVYPTEDNTQIYINGTLQGTRNKRDFFRRISQSEVLMIETSKPSLIYQVSGFGCEVGGGVIPQITCTGSQTVGLSRTSSENFYLNLLVKTGGEGGFTFNGNPAIIPANSFSDVPNTFGEWKYARLLISNSALPAGQGVVIKNAAPFHLGVIHGGPQSGCKFGYFSNFAQFQADIFADNNGVCANTGKTSTLGTTYVGTTYQWFKDGSVIPGAEGSTYTASDPGTYWAEISTLGECGLVESDKMVLPELCPPTFIAQPGDTALCENQKFTLRASATNTQSYNWKKDGVLINGATDSFYTATATVEAAGKYTVVATGIGGSTESDTAAVTIFTLPDAAIGATGPATFCAGGSVTLTAAAGMVSYQWYKDENAIDNATSQTYTADDNGTYWVSVANQHCTASTATESRVTVTVHALPDASITAASATTFCNGNSVTLSTLPYSKTQWYIGGNLADEQPGQHFAATESGAYTAMVTDDKGCTSVTPGGGTVVKVNALPDATFAVAASATICLGDTVKFTALPGMVSYQWMKNADNYPQQTSREFHTSEAGDYNLIVVDTNGCSNQLLPGDAVHVTVNALPEFAPMAAATTSFCEGGSVELEAPANMQSYQWYIDNEVISGATARMLKATKEGYYSLGLTDLNGCYKRNDYNVDPSLHVKVYSLPEPSITADGPLAICSNGQVTLRAPADQAAYTWFKNGVALNEIGRMLTTSDPGTYTVQVTSHEGCQAITALSDAPKVTINKDIIVGISLQNTVVSCPQSTTTLRAVAANGGESPVFEWTVNNETKTETGATYSSSLLKPGTTIQLKVTSDEQGCIKDRTVTSIVYTLKLDPQGDCDGDGIPNGRECPRGYDCPDQDKDGIPDYLSADSDGDGRSDREEGTGDCDNDGLPDYLDKKPCTVAIIMPTLFTPNGDGKNDIIKPVIPGIKSFNYIKIYNRWGNLVYESRDPNQGWNGRMNGRDQPQDTYIWVCSGVDRDGRTIVEKGMFSLVR